MNHRMHPHDGGPPRSENENGFGPERRGGRGRGRNGYGPLAGFDEFGARGPQGHGPRGRRHGGRGRARRGDVRAAVLALLAEEKYNGYQLIQALAERTNGAWKPSPGAIYPALAQLTDEGLISPIEVDGQKLFELTEAGQAEVESLESKPWDAVNAESAPYDAEGAAALFEEFGQLALAARTLAASGTAQQLKAARAELAATKRKLYGLLAAGPEED